MQGLLAYRRLGSDWSTPKINHNVPDASEAGIIDVSDVVNSCGFSDRRRTSCSKKRESISHAPEVFLLIHVPDWCSIEHPIHQECKDLDNA